MFGLILPLAILSGCLPVRTPIPFPTNTGTPPLATETITPVWFPATSTRTPIPSSAVTSTPANLPDYSGLQFSDSFSKADDWVIGSYADGNVALGSDSMGLAVARPGGILTTFRKDTYQTDFYLEMQVNSSLCSPNDSFGPAFWAANSQNYTRLALTCSGQYRLERVKGGKASKLSDWMPSTQLTRGPQLSVKVGLWAGGGLVQVYFNDVFQTELSVSRSTGGLGMFAQSFDRPLTVSFSSLDVYEVLPDNYKPSSTPTVRPTKTPLPTIPTP
jgi:hypothetical protein